MFRWGDCSGDGKYIVKSSTGQILCSPHDLNMRLICFLLTDVFFSDQTYKVAHFGPHRN